MKPDIAFTTVQPGILFAPHTCTISIFGVSCFGCALQCRTGAPRAPKCAGECALETTVSLVALIIRKSSCCAFSVQQV